MRRTLIGVAAIATAWVIALAVPAAAAERQEMISLDTRPGVTQNFLLISPESPVASVVLLEGQNGLLHIFGTKIGENKGFLTTSREKFAAQGFAVALVDAPSDKQSGKGMPPGFRGNKNHVKDLAAVVSWLRQTYQRPVWLIGISQGTMSAAQFAIARADAADGLVLLSAMTKVSKEAKKFSQGEALPEMKLGKIAVPTLLVAHKEDECEYTTTAGLEDIKAKLKRATPVELRYVEGGQSINKKDPCKDNTHHTFYAIEDQVVAAIADFTKHHLSPKKEGRKGAKMAAREPAGAAAGAFRLEAEVRALLVGNTIQYQDQRGRTLSVFFADDGTAVFRAGKGKTLRKKWWFKERGVLCRTVGKNNDEQCSRVAAGEMPGIASFHEPGGKPRYQAKVLPGNQVAP